MSLTRQEALMAIRVFLWVWGFGKRIWAKGSHEAVLVLSWVWDETGHRAGAAGAGFMSKRGLGL